MYEGWHNLTGGQLLTIMIVGGVLGLAALMWAKLAVAAAKHHRGYSAGPLVMTAAVTAIAINAGVAVFFVSVLCFGHAAAIAQAGLWPIVGVVFVYALIFIKIITRPDGGH